MNTYRREERNKKTPFHNRNKRMFSIAISQALKIRLDMDWQTKDLPGNTEQIPDNCNRKNLIIRSIFSTGITIAPFIGQIALAAIGGIYAKLIIW